MADITNIRKTLPLNWPSQTLVKSSNEKKEQHAQHETDKDEDQESDDNNHIDEYV